MGSAPAFELAVKEVERRRARVAAAAEGFLKSTIPLDDLRLESAALSAADKGRDGALREWREPSTSDTAKREVGRLTHRRAARTANRLRVVRSFVDEQPDAAMRDEGLDSTDAEDLEKAASRPSTRALRRALAALEADVCLMRW